MQLIPTFLPSFILVYLKHTLYVQCPPLCWNILGDAKVITITECKNYRVVLIGTLRQVHYDNIIQVSNSIIRGCHNLITFFALHFGRN